MNDEVRKLNNSTFKIHYSILIKVMFFLNFIALDIPIAAG